MRHLVVALILAAIVQAALWFIPDNTTIIPDAGSKFLSLSYSPLNNNREIAEDGNILRDLQILSRHAKKVRTYSAFEAEKVLQNIIDTNLKIDLGIWISADIERNEREISKAIELEKKYSSYISSIIVGNEVLLRGEQTVEQMKSHFLRVDNFTRRPITTAETWDVWVKNPTLINYVNHLTVHILPYWEKIPFENALSYTFDRYNQVVDMSYGKKVVIGEFGWPSRGYNHGSSFPSIENQANLVRNFMIESTRRGIEYNIIEAFDQVWKGVDEGSVGPYWGVFNADRQAKFPLIGEVIVDSLWIHKIIGGILLGSFFTFIGLRGQKLTYKYAITYALAAHAMSFGIVMAVVYPFISYMNFGVWIMWSLGCLLMIPLAIITLSKVNELFRITMGIDPIRLVPLNLCSDRQPFVSIHVPAYKENPDVLIETIEALEKLEYDNYEVLIIINNTSEEEYKSKVREKCIFLPKFKFLDITCTGFKAGALNIALNEHTHPNAEIIAVLDADYVVKSTWLKDLVPLFDDSKVAIVQAPQDHRDGEESILSKAMNAEYAGFFDIGMVQRNEDNAIIVHGTMVMVRKTALHECGNWGTDTIVEDTELGIRLFSKGYTAHYTNRRYGWGLLPDTYLAFKTQRHRWAYGSIQIIKKHFGKFLPSSHELTDAQKHHFITGWFYWLSEAVGAIAAVMNILWVPVILMVGVTIPTIPLTVPLIAAFLVNVLHAFILYDNRVKIPGYRTFLASIASMSLQLVIFKAVFDGIVKDSLPFKRTEKGKNIRKRNKFSVLSETIFFMLLMTAGLALIITNYSAIIDVYIFASTLLIQSIPYLAAFIMWIFDTVSLKKRGIA